MIETEELMCRKLHMPWPGVRIPANTRIALGPKPLVDQLCARGFFERIPPEIIAQESKPPDKSKKISK
jgi:hypothetical protein